MDWVKVKVSHVTYDMAGASLEVRWGWITLLATIAAMERRPTDEQLDKILHIDIHKKLKDYLIKTGTTESAVIDKVMEDVEVTKYKRIKGKERQKHYIDTLHNTSITPSLTGADKIREDKIREDKRRDSSSDASLTPSGASSPVSKKLSDDEFVTQLKNNKAYTHIDLDQELSKMDAWLLTNPARKKTRRFIVNWLNKIDRPIEGKKQVALGAKMLTARELVYQYKGEQQ